MCKIVDFENVSISDRNGVYGGAVGFKEGVLINNEYWIIKYPKNIKSMNATNIFYVASPLSEYIGSHIYEILGFDVHKTVLGVRHDRVVVACKDFCSFPGELREIRTLKNVYHEKLENVLDIETYINKKRSSRVVLLEELLLHIKYNPILSGVVGIEDRFWDCLLIDAVMNNSSRGTSDWGVLLKNGFYNLAPIFSNSMTFQNGLSDVQLEKLMNNTVEFKKNAINIITAYGNKKNRYSFKYFLSQDGLVGLDKSIRKLVPVITEQFPQIEKLINDIPESYNGIIVCSSIRKTFYIEEMKIRINELLIPAYEKILKNEEK